MFTLPLLSNFKKRFQFHNNHRITSKDFGFSYYVNYDADYPNRKINKLELYLKNKSVSIRLPQIIKPAVIRRPNRPNILMDRIFGVVVNSREMTINYGVVNYYDRAGVKDKRKRIPFTWGQQVTIGLCMMDLTNSHPTIEFVNSGMTYTQYREAQEASPALTLDVKDYDGEIAKMSVRIERHTKTKGVGWCTWTRWFRKPEVITSLLIQFDKYLGTQKNSWKGGSKSATVELLPNETVEQALDRFFADPTKFNFEFKSFTRV